MIRVSTVIEVFKNNCDVNYKFSRYCQKPSFWSTGLLYWAGLENKYTMPHWWMYWVCFAVTTHSSWGNSCSPHLQSCICAPPHSSANVDCGQLPGSTMNGQANSLRILKWVTQGYSVWRFIFENKHFCMPESQFSRWSSNSSLHEKGHGNIKEYYFCSDLDMRCFPKDSGGKAWLLTDRLLERDWFLKTLT